MQEKREHRRFLVFDLLRHVEQNCIVHPLKEDIPPTKSPQNLLLTTPRNPLDFRKKWLSNHHRGQMFHVLARPMQDLGKLQNLERRRSLVRRFWMLRGLGWMGIVAVVVEFSYF